ncbi:unnamed protein product [Trifolium pratense]|uniref:Uncharacterized protein n=1 Tax=Trifolium pratense TaxID=57577 RepID=A0ACB0JHI3_TRIPR|nr:unnamed protein product [Trifolium pratense]
MKPDTYELLDVLSRQTEDDIIWEPYIEIQVPEQYISQMFIFKSMITAFTRSNAVNHTPNVAYRQIMDKEPRKLIVNQLNAYLPKITKKRGRSFSKDIKLWLKSWESRKLHIISIDNLPSPQPHNMGMESDLNQDRVLVPNRTHVTNLKNKLIVFDLNGVLVDCVTDDKKLNPDFVFNKTAVFARPSYLEFLEFCFDNFEVGIWSSKFKTNIDKILDFFMKDLKHKFLFRWDQSHCTTTTIPTPENPDKNIMFKELEKLWDKEDPNLCWEKGFFNESNTLLIDDSPYKGMLNPEYNVIYPDTFKYWIGKWDKSLAKGGELRDFLEGLAKADDIRDYVREKSIGRPAVTTINDDNYRYFEAKNSVS